MPIITTIMPSGEVFNHDDALQPAAIHTTGTLRADTAPVDGSDILRKDDLGSVVAPVGAQYVVLAVDGDLTDERVLAVNTTNLSLTDGGAGGNVTIDTVQDIDASATPTFAGMTLSAIPAGVDDTVIISVGGVLSRDEIDSRVWGSSLVDGSGSAGRVSKWSDGNTLTNSIIRDDGTDIGIGIAPSYRFSVGSTDGSDQIGIYHNNTDAYFTTTDGKFRFETDEGTNTSTYISIRGKGTGVGLLDIYDQDDSVYVSLFALSNIGFILVNGGELWLQHTAEHPATFFAGATEGETQELKIFGHRTGDTAHSLQIGVGIDADDTVSFDGVSNYYFDGNVGIGTAVPQELLHVGTGTDGSDITATDLLVTRAGPSNLSVRDSTNNVETFLFASSVGGIMGTVTNDPLNIQ
ncbi:hypothetical protein LCGC14_0600670, partial [marine sediment metagenome]